MSRLTAADWLVPLPGPAVAELEAFVEGLRRDPLPTLLLSPPPSGLACCREVMVEVGARCAGRRAACSNACRGAVLGERTAPRLGAGPTAGRGPQKGRTMLYDVRDTGRGSSTAVRARHKPRAAVPHRCALLDLPRSTSVPLLNTGRGRRDRFVSLPTRIGARAARAGIIKRLTALPWERQDGMRQTTTRSNAARLAAGPRVVCRYKQVLSRPAVTAGRRWTRRASKRGRDARDVSRPSADRATIPAATPYLETAASRCPHAFKTEPPGDPAPPHPALNRDRAADIPRLKIHEERTIPDELVGGFSISRDGAFTTCLPGRDSFAWPMRRAGCFSPVRKRREGTLGGDNAAKCFASSRRY